MFALTCLLADAVRTIGNTSAKDLAKPRLQLAAPSRKLSPAQTGSHLTYPLLLCSDAIGAAAMNGLDQLFRALVMESLALVLLFSLAFGRLQQPEAPEIASRPSEPATRPGPAEASHVPSKAPRLAIMSAPGRGRQLAERSAEAVGRHFGGAARCCYETALRINRRPTPRPTSTSFIRLPSKRPALRR